jgi:hypothetical protein
MAIRINATNQQTCSDQEQPVEAPHLVEHRDRLLWGLLGRMRDCTCIGFRIRRRTRADSLYRAEVSWTKAPDRRIQIKLPAG